MSIVPKILDVPSVITLKVIRGVAAIEKRARLYGGSIPAACKILTNVMGVDANLNLYLQNHCRLDPFNKNAKYSKT